MAATIKDIEKFVPMDSNKKFCLDTNILYWYVYPRYNKNDNAAQYNAAPYYDFVDKLVENGNPLYTTVYNLSELLNIIEKKEYEIYKATHPEYAVFTRKDFRRVAKERSTLKKMMQATVSTVSSICKVVEFDFSVDRIHKFIGELPNHRCDVFDYLIIDKYIEDGKINVVSDDGDFLTMNGITVYTTRAKILPDM